MSRGPRSRGSSRALVLAVLLITTLIAIALIGVSPVALGWLHGDTVHWERLSFIGQTYGAASALISVLALVGIVMTLIYQAREARLAREETRRTAIAELLKMAIDDPELDECWGPIPSPNDAKTRKQRLYTNMIVSEWSMSFETKALPEKRLRAIAYEMFQGEIGRSYWHAARDVRLSTSESRTRRRFHEILDEEYRRALSTRKSKKGESGSSMRLIVKRLPRALVVATGIFALLYRAWRRRR
jgi:Family of unknown function (DUF6082)